MLRQTRHCERSEAIHGGALINGLPRRLWILANSSAIGALVALASCAPMEQPARPLTVDFVLVDKSDRMLTLYGQGQPLRAYRGLQFGDAPVGHKRFEGDERTPEGRYRIDYRNPESRYHLSLHISYPDARDRAFAERWGRSPGGEIFIHGQPKGYFGRVKGDWTDGCIALSNEEIEELWRFIPDGTPIEIRP